MAAQTTKISQDQLIEAAKAPLVNYGKKDWDAVKASITSDFVYDEVATQRKVKGVDQVLPLWKGWATAFPDSKATFHSAFVTGDTVVLEVSWKGTHTGPLKTADRTIAPTNKKIDLRACSVIELAGEKAKLQRQYFDMATMFQQLGIKT